MTGKELKALRKRLRYNGISFAKKLGVARSTLSYWENEIRPIPEEQEVMIRKTLGFERGQRADLFVHIDYLRLTFFDGDVETIMTSVLGIASRHFATESRAKHNYDYWHSCGSIVLMSKNDNTQGILLDLTSEGIQQFEQHLMKYGITLQEWLKQVLNPEYYLKSGYYSRIHSTRLDIAIDEMYDEVRGNFDLKKLQEKKHQNLIHSSLTTYKEIRTLKATEEFGITMMFGARGNDRIFIRLYEKRHELANKLNIHVEDVLAEYGVYNRYELELGKDVNLEIFNRYLNGESLEDIAIEILLTKIEVYEEVETDTGLELRAFTQWYDIFGHWKKIKISSPTDEISIERSMRWIETQAAPTMEMVRRLFGETWAFDWLRLCMDKVELSPNKEKQLKYEEMLADNKENMTFLYFDKKIKKD
jgi:phage replication initiation protein